MKPMTALGGGLAGACAVSLLHETARRMVPQAPRMDLLGKEAIVKSLRASHHKVPGDESLFLWALAGDIFSNAIYYSITGMGKSKNMWARSAAMGLVAGIGAVALPKHLGLNEKHSNRSTTTQLMTVGLYLTGALITTAVIKMLERKKSYKAQVWEQKLVTSAMG